MALRQSRCFGNCGKRNRSKHRVTAAVRDHLVENKRYSLRDIFEMLRVFGEKNGKTEEMHWALEQAAKFL